jgi:hypothetical protein
VQDTGDAVVAGQYYAYTGPVREICSIRDVRSQPWGNTPKRDRMHHSLFQSLLGGSPPATNRLLSSKAQATRSPTGPRRSQRAMGSLCIMKTGTFVESLPLREESFFTFGRHWHERRCGSQCHQYQCIEARFSVWILYRIIGELAPGQLAPSRVPGWCSV